jgi:hypothetical protein
MGHELPALEANEIRSFSPKAGHWFPALPGNQRNCRLCLPTPPAFAATFLVDTREDVLKVTATIQASQFLTHATFGPTEEEITAPAA